MQRKTLLKEEVVVKRLIPILLDSRIVTSQYGDGRISYFNRGNFDKDVYASELFVILKIGILITKAKIKSEYMAIFETTASMVNL
jgi:hypothetical protein